MQYGYGNHGYGHGHGAGAPPVTCPRCHSFQVAGNARGFSLGKAVGGGLLLGPIGLLAGAHGNARILISCLSCGHQWAPVPPKPKVDQSGWIGLAVIVLFALLGIGFLMTMSHRGQANSVVLTKDEAARRAEVDVDADTLAAAFKDEPRGSATWQGKYVSVRGVVAQVTNQGSFAVVTLTRAKPDVEVRIKNDPRAYRLKAKEAVVFRHCLVSGGATGHVRLDGCAMPP